MKQLDRHTIEGIGIPSPVLMERAALATVSEIHKAGYDTTHAVVICAKGNNGGDGVCIARLLKEEHFDPVVYMLQDLEEGSECARQVRIADRLGVHIVNGSVEACADFLNKTPCTILIDAIFGIGFHGEPDPSYHALVDRINDLKVPVVSVDIPTGVDASSGNVPGPAIKSDLCVTFGSYKIGQFLYPGCEYCKKLIMHPIGIFPGEAEEDDVFAVEKDDLKEIKRSAYSNKGTFGKVLLIAGSKSTGGAAVLSATSALRSGAGMVMVYTHEKNRDLLLNSIPEVMVRTYDSDPGELSGCLQWADVIAIGPGLASELAYELLKTVILTCELPLVMDADALNLLSGHPELMDALGEQDRTVIITPHLGEFSRLVKRDVSDIRNDLITSCKGYAKEHRLICVLKDARTVISDGEKIYLNVSGNSGMATAGSGDVLTGLIASLLGQGIEPLKAAAYGCCIHGLSGDLAAKEKGMSGMIASDMIPHFSDFVI